MLHVQRNAKEFKSNCQHYFIEVVSTLCFGGQRAPEPDLIKMLLDIVFTESDSGMVTQEMVPLSDEKRDKIPVIRSSLLQLLLEHEYVYMLCILSNFAFEQLSSH